MNYCIVIPAGQMIYQEYKLSLSTLQHLIWFLLVVEVWRNWIGTEVWDGLTASATIICWNFPKATEILFLKWIGRLDCVCLISIFPSQLEVNNFCLFLMLWWWWWCNRFQSAEKIFWHHSGKIFNINHTY